MRPLLRPLWAWVLADLARLARDGVALRAVLAPPVLLAGTLGLTGVVVGSAGPDLPVAVAAPELARELEAAGFAVSLTDDPRAALDEGAADRAVVWSGEAWAVHARPRGWARWSGRRARADLQLEAVVRDHVGARWRIDVPPMPDTRGEQPANVALLARILSVLYTLYAVVLAVASTVRDRETGVHEARAAAPVPGWLHPLARGLALTVGVGAVLVVTQLAVGALLGHARPVAWGTSGLGAVVMGVAIGLAAPTGGSWQPLGPFTGAPDGLSTPLSRALVVTTALGGVGVGLPEVGAWLPVAGVVAEPTSMASLTVGLVGAWVVLAGAAVRAGRGGW